MLPLTPCSRKPNERIELSYTPYEGASVPDHPANWKAWTRTKIVGVQSPAGCHYPTFQWSPVEDSNLIHRWTRRGVSRTRDSNSSSAPYKGAPLPERPAKADAENRTRVSPVPGEGVAISTTSAKVRPLRIELSPHRVRAGYATVNTWDAKSSRRDSNPQPPPWQGGAQPIELLLRSTQGGI